MKPPEISLNPKVKNKMRKNGVEPHSRKRHSIGRARKVSIMFSIHLKGLDALIPYHQIESSKFIYYLSRRQIFALWWSELWML